MYKHKLADARRRCAPKLAARPILVLLAAAMTLPGGSAHSELVMSRPATNCSLSNQGGGPWREVTPLTSTSQIGDVLFERGAGLFNNFQFGDAVSSNVLHELVAAAQWNSNAGVDADGTARTNVRGIGLQVSVMGADGVERRVRPGAFPVVMDKRPVYFDTAGSTSQQNSTVTEYIQRLVLTDSAANLPSGKLEVTGVDPNITLTLYTIDYQQDMVGYGDNIQEFPAWSPPIPGVCSNQPHSYQGTGVVGMGGGGGVVLPNKCEVGAFRTIPVSLGEWPVSEFGGLNGTTPSQDFSIELSQCSATARPTITLTDKYGPHRDPNIYSLKPGPQAAEGVAIVIVNKNGGGHAKPGMKYRMTRVGDRAVMELKAHYLLTARDISEIKAGIADGSAEFTFEFP